jgi:xanthine dehydrogenase YagS FAD-binding subunit
MRPFAYVRASDVAGAVQVLATEPDAKLLGGGTNLVDLMRADVERPATVVDISALPLTEVVELPDGGLRIGALVRNSHLAAHRLVRSRYPVLAQALLSGASGQLRNMATVGGNLMQRTRCLYFSDDTAACNKRRPGSGCDAVGGFHRNTAVLGTSESCIAAHPSDMAVALAALDAVVEVESVRGSRRIPLVDLHHRPGDRPDVESDLAADELITAVELPAAPVAATSGYRKVLLRQLLTDGRRDRGGGGRRRRARRDHTPQRAADDPAAAREHAGSEHDGLRHLGELPQHRRGALERAAGRGGRRRDARGGAGSRPARPVRLRGAPGSHELRRGAGRREARRPEPARMALTREGAYRTVGGRSPTAQRVALGAERDGALTALVHTGISQTGRVGVLRNRWASSRGTSTPRRTS